MKQEPGFVSERYRKQALFRGIGPDGQQKLATRKVVLIGCGALGCVLADAMVRAGVGHVRIVDRDFVELSNLQRQVLFTEDDVRQHLPKTIAAASRLQTVNSEIRIEPVIADVDFTNILSLVDGADLILDGTDNFEIRYLINDVSLQTGIPWIFTGCTGSAGQMMPVFPGKSACLRCLIPLPPPPGTTETCDTAGVLGPAIGAIASLQAAVALRILSRPGTNLSQPDGVPLTLTIVDVWDGTFRQMDVSTLRERSDCPACHQGERLWLEGSHRSGSTVLCGRNAVQISPPEKLAIRLDELAARLNHLGKVTSNSFLIRLQIEAPAAQDPGAGPIELTLFPDGRAIIKGTEDPAAARTIYSRYVGS
ncbi:MAG: ThiF family adenylyltransferase [Planctomycetaceae bacterium]|nr:ThiF family adenylyltransferase [Planctomycetaceae bacterium]